MTKVHKDTFQLKAEKLDKTVKVLDLDLQDKMEEMVLVRSNIAEILVMMLV
jgi:hypothetical protein